VLRDEARDLRAYASKALSASVKFLLEKEAADRETRARALEETGQARDARNQRHRAG
jgi:hypothetical protein